MSDETPSVPSPTHLQPDDPLSGFVGPLTLVSSSDLVEELRSRSSTFLLVTSNPKDISSLIVETNFGPVAAVKLVSRVNELLVDYLFQVNNIDYPPRTHYTNELDNLPENPPDETPD